MLAAMTAEPVRRLAAVMFADIVGYTALMQRSETAAMESRRRFRSVLSAALDAHEGEVVQHYGDGTLCVFASAVEAVRCAVALQVVLPPEDVPLRVGVHIGDIVRDAEGAYGHGVNVAARIQALAVPGSVLVTDRVAEQIRNHEIELADLGSHRLKNVERPVGVLAVRAEGVVLPDPKSVLPSAPGASVAVLPFADMSPGVDQGAFSDGMAEEIINVLAQADWLKVTSRTSSFAFRDHSGDVREIARTLDVSHVLEGSVRTAGERVRVTAQLIDADSGFHVFSRSWERDWSDVFQVQDEIATAIAEAFADKLGRGTPSLPAVDHRPPDSEAYRLYLEGRQQWNTWSPEGAVKSIALYRRALEIDPNLDLAYSAIAFSFAFLGVIGRLRPAEAHAEIKRMATHALEREPRSAEAELALGMAALFFEWDRAGTERHLARAVEFGPGSAVVHHFRGMAAMVLRRFGDALGAIETAADLDPLSPSISTALAEAMAHSGQPERALEQIGRTRVMAPEFRGALDLQAFIHVAAGQYEPALEALDAYRSLSPSPFAGAALRGFVLFRTGEYAAAMEQHQRLEERERIEPDTALDVDFAILYLGMRKYEWALRRLERAVDARVPGVVYIECNPIWEELRDHPRYRELIARIGLWAPPDGGI